jgi:hypothetical protein
MQALSPPNPAESRPVVPIWIRRGRAAFYVDHTVRRLLPNRNAVQIPTRGSGTALGAG